MDHLIVICGPPGAGKTTIARPIASALRLPLIEKDAIKEALLDVLGSGDIEWSRKLSAASFAAMFALARDLNGAVLEGNFNASHAPELLQLDSNPIEIFCRCDRAELVRRIRDRKRHPGHLDEITEQAVVSGVPSDQPLRLGGPFREVETTSPVDTDKLVQWVKKASATT